MTPGMTHAPAVDSLDTLDLNLQGSRLGLVMNHTSVDSTGRPTLEKVSRQGGRVVRLFAPEHGLAGSLPAGQGDQDRRDGGAPDPTDPVATEVVSLYGPRLFPEPSHLVDLDTVIFDIQDVGVRAFTYSATLLGVLRAAARAGVPVSVFDRPNPLGRRVEGPGLSPGWARFVAPFDIPLRHGLTLGEFARLAALEEGLPAPHVLRCCWDGHLRPEKAPWTPPSPNLRDSGSALLYAGLVLLEGTNLSEGRGTPHPFTWFGAPWLDAEHLAAQLNSIAGTAVTASPETRTPAGSKHADQACNGLTLHVGRPAQVRSVDLAIAILTAVARRHPDKLTINPMLTALWGGPGIAAMLSGALSSERLHRWMTLDHHLFSRRRRACLLYPDPPFEDDRDEDC